MDFELSVFVRREDYGKVLHELNSALEEALLVEGIGVTTPIQLPQLQLRGAGNTPTGAPKPADLVPVS